MESGETLYLLMVLGGFVVFVATLAYVSAEERRNRKK